MKKILFTLSLCLLGGSLLAQKTVIKINPLPAFVLTANAAIERQVAPQFSVQLGGIYTGASFQDYTFRGFGITPEVHYYFPNQQKDNANSPEGFYAAPYFRYYNFTLENDGDTPFKGEVNITGGGVVLGYQVLAGQNNNFAFSVFAGPGYLSQGKVDIERGEEEDFEVPSILNGFAPRFGLTIGLAF